MVLNEHVFGIDCVELNVLRILSMSFQSVFAIYFGLKCFSANFCPRRAMFSSSFGLF